jgi:hypothetical protein
VVSVRTKFSYGFKFVVKIPGGDVGEIRPTETGQTRLKSWVSDKTAGWTSGFRLPLGAEEGICSATSCPDRLWGPPSLLFIGCRWLFFPGDKAAEA